MKLHTIIQAAQKPAVYSKGTAQMWTDKYISDRLLEVHLNPDIDLASRSASTIDSTVDWILEKVPGKKLEILDLGCGPGLYAEKMSQKGHHVTGIDFSQNSIRHARESAQQKDLNINYRQQNYLEIEEVNRYDLVMMIFTDFGVLLPDERVTLLANIKRALKPGGTFLFDVLNDNYSIKEEGSRSWESAEKGFWRDHPYLALTESFYYEPERVTLTQHIISDADEKVEIYRFWIHTFSNAELETLLSDHNFRNIECYDRIIPGCNMYSSGDVTFCIANV